MCLKKIIMMLSLLTSFAFAFHAQAEDTNSKYGTEVNIQFGTLLPDQIKGVTELLPVWAFLYKIPFAGAGLEFGILNTHAYGLDYTTFPVRGRFDIPIDADLAAMVYAGPEINYYTETNSNDRNAVVGFHLGGGAMFHVLETVWLRAEMKYSVNPGDSLYFGFGFSFRGTDSGAN
jgi:hypothetical protein